MRLCEQARSVCSKLSVMVDAEMNVHDDKPSSSAEEAENGHETTGAHAIPPYKL